MNTPNISGSWFDKLQVVSADGEVPRGLLIKEKAGGPVLSQLLLPKLTSIEFCALHVVLNKKPVNK